jgi:hypothetical protein
VLAFNSVIDAANIVGQILATQLLTPVPQVSDPQAPSSELRAALHQLDRIPQTYGGEHDTRTDHGGDHGAARNRQNIYEAAEKLKAQSGITDDQLLEFASKSDADGLARTQAWIAKLNAAN